MTTATVKDLCMWCEGPYHADESGRGCHDCGTYKPWPVLPETRECPECQGSPMLGGVADRPRDGECYEMRAVWCSYCKGRGYIEVIK